MTAAPTAPNVPRPMLFPTVSFSVFFLALAFARQFFLRRGWLAKRWGSVAANDALLLAAGVAFCAPLGVFFCAFVALFCLACVLFDHLTAKAWAREAARAARLGLPKWKPARSWIGRGARAAKALALAAIGTRFPSMVSRPMPASSRRVEPQLHAPVSFVSAPNEPLAATGKRANPAAKASVAQASAEVIAPCARRSLEDEAARFWRRRASRTSVAFLLSRPGSRFWVALGCAAILAPLLILKYQAFFAGALADSLSAIGLPSTPSWLAAASSVDWRAPAGASFLTFNGLAFLLRRHLPRAPEAPLEVHWSRAIAFLTFFPALLSGPLWRVEPFSREADALREPLWAKGSAAFLVGFALKVCVAGWAGIVADSVFQTPDRYGAFGLWIGAQSYGAQLYADFAGYSLMALGVGFWLGMSIPRNFMGPYLAAGPREFWRRWHASLGAWFRDHLYIPLGGNRRGAVILARNSMAVMLVCGLWHGAGWTYLLWGAIHGAWLAAGSVFAPIGAFLSRHSPPVRRWREAIEKAPSGKLALRVVVWVAALEFALLAWIPFRCPDFVCVNAFAHGLLSWSEPAGLGALAAAVALACLAATLLEQRFGEALGRGLERLFERAGPLWAVLGGLLIWLAIICSPSGLPNFIYFQF
jgi:alginate O-acetyltransferase complex protein AlgI